MLLSAHRRVKGLPAAEVDQFWMAQGSRIEQHLHAAAVEVAAAFRTFSAAGLVASANDRHLINQDPARRSNRCDPPAHGHWPGTRCPRHNHPDRDWRRTGDTRGGSAWLAQPAPM